MHTLHIAAICLTDPQGRLLVVRKHNSRFWMLPGGKTEHEETPFLTMKRELLEETGIHISKDQATYLGEFEAAAANEPDTRVNAHIFYGNYARTVIPQAELAEAKWVYPAHLTPTDTAPLLLEAVIPAWMMALATTQAAR
jgi:8-oxo-dGTP diphosphatase